MTLHAQDEEFVFDLEVQETRLHKTQSQPHGGVLEMAPLAKGYGIYMVWLTRSRDCIDSSDGALGTFQALQEANDAAMESVLEEGNEDENYKKNFSKDGSISI